MNLELKDIRVEDLKFIDEVKIGKAVFQSYTI